jgi:DNA-directed RNA polymerase specialized sigma24 family protein
MDRISPALAADLHQHELARTMGAISRLGEENRIVLALYYVEGLSGPEIAEVLGLSEAAFHEFFAAALTALRAEGGDVSRLAA